MDEYQQQNGITRKVKATYYFPDQPDCPVEKDFWSARVQLVYYKKRIFRPRVESVTSSKFVETVNKKSTRKTTFYMEILNQFFNDRRYVIDGTLYGKRNKGKKFWIADTQLKFCCDKIEYDWKTVKP